MRLGCAPGECGLIGRMLGGLACFLLFGGTSKYCSDCRKLLKQQQEETEGKVPANLDKGPLFRIIWFVVAAGILLLLASA
jgi:hypothetical protein